MPMLSGEYLSKANNLKCIHIVSDICRHSCIEHKNLYNGVFHSEIPWVTPHMKMSP